MLQYELRVQEINMLKLLLLNLLAGFYFANVNAKMVVETKEGILHGKEIINDNGKVYHTFTGIPYAEPPVGNFRFKVNIVE